MKLSQVSSIPNLTHNVECMIPRLFQRARETGKRTVKPEHILLELGGQNHGFGGAILMDHLRKLGIKVTELKEKLFGNIPNTKKSAPEITFGKDTIKIFEDAKKLTEGSVGGGELLLAIAKRFGNTGKIKELKLNPDSIERELKERNPRIPYWRRLI